MESLDPTTGQRRSCGPLYPPAVPAGARPTPAAAARSGATPPAGRRARGQDGRWPSVGRPAGRAVGGGTGIPYAAEGGSPSIGTRKELGRRVSDAASLPARAGGAHVGKSKSQRGE